MTIPTREEIEREMEIEFSASQRVMINPLMWTALIEARLELARLEAIRMEQSGEQGQLRLERAKLEAELAKLKARIEALKSGERRRT